MSNKKKVYVETTVISDLTSRPSPLVRNLARQLATKEWWDDALDRCEFYVSQLVLDLARKFLDAAAIPETSFDDATHVAIATIAKMDYLATWNCKHINNPQTLPKIIKVCEENGFKCPLIGTPDQLKEVRDEND